MVSIVTSKKRLLALAKATLNDAELADALLEIKCSVESYDPHSDALTLEVTGDRPDLLSGPGVARALAGSLGHAKGIPAMRLAPAKHTLIADPSGLSIRPFIVSALVNNVKLDDELIAELFNQQEKIVLTHGRKRSKVSVGACDLSKVTHPITFRGLPPIAKYVPLGFENSMTLAEVLESHPKGKEYAHLLSAHKQLPVLQDAAGEIIALIPVSNAAGSAVNVRTTSFFVDAEGTDFAACNTALSIMCQDFSDLGWTIEPMHIHYPDRTIISPLPSNETLKVSVAKARGLLGADLSAEQMVEALQRQRLDATESGGWITATIPSFRGDFLHPVDVIEEIAIGYGFNKFTPLPPSKFTKGTLSPQTLEENRLRDFFLGAGFLELSTHVLTNDSKVRKAHSEESLVEISNPVSKDYHALRGSLLPNLLEVLSENTHSPYPQRIFEVGEVVVPDESVEERTRTVRRACIVSAHAHASLTEAASVLGEFATHWKKKLLLKPLSSTQFIEGRGCEVVFDGKVVGRMGELSPRVLLNFGLAVPAAAFEIEC